MSLECSERKLKPSTTPMVSFNIPSLLSGSSIGTLLSSDKTNCKLDKDNEELPSFL
jgi:hypothetical protein